jgi:hypothetical protein
MKHFLCDQAGDDKGQGAGGQPDFKKVLDDGLKGLSDEIKKLNQRIDQQNKPPQTVKKPAQEPEEDLSTLMILDPKKAVEKITAKVKEEVQGSAEQQAQAQGQFNDKYMELANDYPEISDQSSELFKRAREIMSSSQAGRWDTGAMERAVLKAAAEKGIQPMKHRKQVEPDDDSYLGGGSTGEGRRQERKNRSEKLPAATLAFAELVGLNVKDSKVVESLTKHHNERKGNWSKYR